MASDTLARTDGRLSLTGLPDVTLALALGIAFAQPSARYAGRVSLIVDELKRRGVYHAMLATIDPHLAAKIDLADRADRGQRWAQTGHTH